MATVAVDATYAVDPEPSGIANYSRRLIESLSILDRSDHFLLCYRLSRLRQRRKFLKPSARADGRGPTFSTCVFQEPFTFWLPWQADIFHSLAQRPPAFHFRKEIVTIFDIFPITGETYSAPEFRRKFAQLLREAVTRAARIITLSVYTARQLQQYCGVGPQRIRVIPAGVDMPQRVLSAEERKEERQRIAGSGHELIVCVGVVQTRKNTLNALRALALLPEKYRLALAGGTKGYGNEEAYEYIRSARLESRVISLGYVPASELSVLYQAATVFLFPSLEEGFGLPVLEAMAHGTPVVTSHTSSLPEVGGDAALYVNPHEPADIARNVLRAAENQVERNRMIQQGRMRASHFTWQRAAEQTCAVYDEVLAGAVSPD